MTTQTDPARRIHSRGIAAVMIGIGLLLGVFRVWELLNGSFDGRSAVLGVIALVFVGIGIHHVIASRPVSGVKNNESES